MLILSIIITIIVVILPAIYLLRINVNQEIEDLYVFIWILTIMGLFLTFELIKSLHQMNVLELCIYIMKFIVLIAIAPLFDFLSMKIRKSNFGKIMKVILNCILFLIVIKFIPVFIFSALCFFLLISPYEYISKEFQKAKKTIKSMSNK